MCFFSAAGTQTLRKTRSPCSKRNGFFVVPSSKLQRTCAVKLTKPSKLFVFGKSLEDTIIYSRLHYSVSYLATLSWSVKLRARLVMPLYVKLLYSVSLPSSCSGVMTTSCPVRLRTVPVLRLTNIIGHFQDPESFLPSQALRATPVCVVGIVRHNLTE
jgi:hypothetical protein